MAKTVNRDIADNRLRTAFLGSAATGLALFAMGVGTTGVSAQDASSDEIEVEEVVVTGSRIVRKDLTATSPVTVLNSEDVTIAGVTKIEDLVNSLPQAFASQGANLANGSTGAANVNLRGLGRARTLVLVNGRRLMPGDPQSPFADINTIPAAMIQRVDVLTGGASSVYGADAVAGVVNFVMDTQFEGLKMDAQYSFNQHNNNNQRVQDLNAARNFNVPDGSVTDGGTLEVTMAFGGSFGSDDRGHFSAYATYHHANEVLQGNRDYSACALNATASDFVCAGSGTSPTGTFLLFDSAFENQLASYTVDQTTGEFRTATGADQYNYAPFNHYQRPDERFTAGAFVNYKVNDHFEPYMEFMFMDDKTNAQIAPAGNFGNTASLNCNNFFLTDAQFDAICGDLGLTEDDSTNLIILRRNVEGGPRNSNRRHTDYRFVAGFKGDIDDNWSYDTYGLYATNVFQNVYKNDTSISRITRALDVVDDGSGNPVCQSVVDGTDPLCVPWNIFAPGGVTDAAAAYIGVPGVSIGDTKTHVFNAAITGNLENYGIMMPTASEGVGVAFGVEYRKESIDFQPDLSFSSGDLAGQGGATNPVQGSYNVKEFFAEARVPLVQDKAFAQDLTLELAYRYSDYNTSGSTDAYKFALEYAPSSDIRFRGSYNRAVRAPNVVELFSPQSVALDGVTDPCTGPAVNGTVNGFTAAQCALTGVSASQFGNLTPNPANQYNGFQGGNPNLTPEVSDTYTVGFVFTPSFIPGFTMTADWFDITIDNNIGTVGADIILSTCLQSGEASFCDLIQRDQAGSLWLTPNGFVVDTNLNTGTNSTKGIDVSANYAAELGDYGSLRFSLNGTWLDELRTQIALADYDCVGYFGPTCGTPTPEWRHRMRANWETPWDFSVALTWRYFASVDVDASSEDPDLAAAPTSSQLFPDNLAIGAQSYFDLSFNWQALDNVNFRAGINNVFDREPPILGNQVLPSTFGSGNTFPQVYDSLGRYIFFGATVEF